MSKALSEAETRGETLKALLEIGAIADGAGLGYTADNPPSFRYFLSYHPEENCLNVCALATNFEMHPEWPGKWTGKAHEVYCERTPVYAQSQGYVPRSLEDNSEVTWGGANPDLLGPEIVEEMARTVHPRLFQVLDKKDRTKMREA
jgi:hypothetical protein